MSFAMARRFGVCCNSSINSHQLIGGPKNNNASDVRIKGVKCEMSFAVILSIRSVL